MAARAPKVKLLRILDLSGSFNYYFRNVLLARKELQGTVKSIVSANEEKRKRAPKTPQKRGRRQGRKRRRVTDANPKNEKKRKKRSEREKKCGKKEEAERRTKSETLGSTRGRKYVFLGNPLQEETVKKKGPLLSPHWQHEVLAKFTTTGLWHSVSNAYSRALLWSQIRRRTN